MLLSISIHLLNEFRGYINYRCIDAIKDFVDSNAKLLAAGCFVLAVLLFMGVVGSLIIICCIAPKRKIRAATVYKYDTLETNII